MDNKFSWPWLMVVLLPLAGCDQKKEAPAVQTPAASTASLPLTTDAAGDAPTAADLSSLAGPVALFPDVLLAQVLAASTTPDDIVQAYVWLVQHKTLAGDARLSAIDAQAWSPAVKALTGFEDVLTQMVQNLPWTRALGEAYIRSPANVMNAVQTLRQRAADKGTLKNSPQQRVIYSPRGDSPPGQGSVSSTGTTNATMAPHTPVPAVIRQTITIQPATPGVVYVPVYGGEIYGSPPVVYPPGYAYSSGDMLVTGLLSFTAGVALGAAASNHWGWDNWGMRWGPAPVVVYNHQTFVNRTVIHDNHTPWQHPYLAPGPVHVPHFSPIRGPVVPGRYVAPAIQHPMTPPSEVNRYGQGIHDHHNDRAMPEYHHHIEQGREQGPVRRVSAQGEPFRQVRPGFSGQNAPGLGLTDEHILDGVTRRHRG